MKATRLLSALILTACMGFGSVTAQNATCQNCTSKGEKTCKMKLSPEQRMEAQAQQMGKRLMLDESKLAQFTSLYKEYLTALKACRPDAKANKVKPSERTDAQIQQDIEQRFEVRQKVLDTQKKYYASFKKILNAAQLEKVFDMAHTGKTHKGNHCMKQGKMGKPGNKSASGCQKACPQTPKK